jgi:hypothetical protein
MPSTPDLTRLLAEIERREAIAREAADCEGTSEPEWHAHGLPDNEVTSKNASVAFCDDEPIADHIALHDPADALRRYAHYRKVLERHRSDNDLPSMRRFWECVACSYEIECNSDRYSEHTNTVPWPCPDYLDVAEALGIETGDADAQHP